MATYCPCGCGEKLGFTDRGIAKKVRAFDDRLEFLTEYALPIEENAPDGNATEMRRFIAQGKEIRDDLVRVLHGADARIIDRHGLNAWHREALAIESDRKAAVYRAHKAAEGG